MVGSQEEGPLRSANHVQRGRKREDNETQKTKAINYLQLKFNQPFIRCVPPSDSSIYANLLQLEGCEEQLLRERERERISVVCLATLSVSLISSDIHSSWPRKFKLLRERGPSGGRCFPEIEQHLDKEDTQ